VLIPVFNRRDLIATAVESALTQDVDDLNVTVVDNCSDDGTWEVVQALQGERCRATRNRENIGLFGNFNRCGELISGEFSLLLCSDDRLEPGFLSRAISLARKHPSVVMVTSRGLEIDSQGRPGKLIADRFEPGIYAGHSVLPAWFWCTHFCGMNALNYPSGVLFRTSALRAALPFRAQIGGPAEVDLYFRVMAQGDLCVDGGIGCRVMRHSEQEGTRLRKSGELLRQNLRLIDEHRQDLEAVDAYKSIRRQSACTVFATLLRALRSDRTVALRIWEDYRGSILTMVVAVGNRAVFKLLARLFGYKPCPYLLRVDVE
jgi:glycosyltransferase involved in cell wall biosynthesis